MPDLSKQIQKIAHDEVAGNIGDCWRTAIACLLEIEQDKVPHFAELYPDEETLDWWYASVKFIESKLPGMTLVCTQVLWPWDVAPDDAPEKVIVSGKSPRGDFYHSVIYNAKTGELNWDPHPSGAGILDQIEVFGITRKFLGVNRGYAEIGEKTYG